MKDDQFITLTRGTVVRIFADEEAVTITFTDKDDLDKKHIVRLHGSTYDVQGILHTLDQSIGEIPQGARGRRTNTYTVKKNPDTEPTA